MRGDMQDAGGIDVLERFLSGLLSAEDTSLREKRLNRAGFLGGAGERGEVDAGKILAGGDAPARRRVRRGESLRWLRRRDPSHVRLAEERVSDHERSAGAGPPDLHA